MRVVFNGHVRPRPTPKELVERLEVVLGARTADELVRRLHERGVTVQLRSIVRWKAGESGPQWDKAVELLAIAGWLSTESDAPAARSYEDPIEIVRVGVARLLVGQAELLKEVKRVRAGERPARPRGDRNPIAEGETVA